MNFICMGIGLFWVIPAYYWGRRTAFDDVKKDLDSLRSDLQDIVKMGKKKKP